MQGQNGGGRKRDRDRGGGTGVVVSQSRPPLSRKCTLGCPVLDSFLRGGIPCGSITELVGECSSAKTQICLQLLLSVQLPAPCGGLGGSSLYIYTESYFPSRRLRQLANAFGEHWPRQCPGQAAGKIHHCDADRPLLSHAEALQERMMTVKREALVSDSHEPVGFTDTIGSNHRNYHAHHNSKAERHTEIWPEHMNCIGNHDSTAEKHATIRDIGHDYMKIGHHDSKAEMHAATSNRDSREKNIADEFSPSKADINAIGHGNSHLEHFGDPCDHIFVQAIQTVEELWSFLEQVFILLSRPRAMPVKLIIIDSIAALFCSDFDNNPKDLAKRTEWFFKISIKLKQYAHQFDMAVLVTNQVVGHVEPETSGRSDSLQGMLPGSYPSLFTSGRRVVPALGIAWAHCVNTRIFLSRNDELHEQNRFLQFDEASSKASYESQDLSRAPEAAYVSTVAESHALLLEHLESEVPDSLLLSISQHKATQEGPPTDRNLITAGCKLTESNTHASSKVRRTMQVAFALNLPSSFCEFVVGTDWVYGVAPVPSDPY